MQAGPGYREGPTGNRPGPQGGTQDTRPPCNPHPLQPCRASGARFAGIAGFLARRGGWVVLPGIPTRLYPPNTRTQPVPLPDRSAHYTYTVLGTALFGQL